MIQFERCIIISSTKSLPFDKHVKWPKDPLVSREFKSKESDAKIIYKRFYNYHFLC